MSHITPRKPGDVMWRTCYQGRWYGAVFAATEKAALAKVRAMNPHHLPDDFAVARARDLPLGAEQ